MNTPAKQKILIVDDEPVMRTIAESVLSQHEFNVITAESAEIAIALIANGDIPDLILLDVMMPGMNGFEACRILRNDPHLEHLPIIMLTALDDQQSIDKAYSHGATDFITKPLNIPLLPHRIRYLLRSAQTFRELVANQIALVNTQHIAHLGNWTVDDSGTVMDASREYLAIIGCDRIPLREEALLLRVHREDRGTLLRRRLEMQDGRAYRIDYRLQSPGSDGDWLHVHEEGFPDFDERNQYIGGHGFTQDISDRITQEIRIRQLAWHDNVTGLYNRTRLQDLIERDISTDGLGQPMAMLYIHLANLRELLTVLGHDIVDGAVRALASRLRSLLASTPTCCDDEQITGSLGQAVLGRYDEHSFVVALPGISHRETIRCFATHAHSTLERPLIQQGEEVLIKNFIGIAYYPQDATDTPELMRRSMLVALNAASISGNSVTFFDACHDREASQRMILERGLRAALEQGGQLQPYFQPKIDAQSGKMVGAEVLLRWLHPDFGMISPADFIPLAEEVGLIHPISEWLVSHVFDLIADWRTWGQLPGPISINLSAASFFERTLIQFIDEELQRSGIPAECVLIELTESVLMHNGDVAQHVIESLRDRGMGVSLDDFGTGFSSLGYLNRFSIDEIKIDRSFIVDLDHDSKERALVHAIVSLGHALGLKVVAEGIETSAQATLLRSMGCDLLQGFYFARPMPAPDFAKRLAQESAVGSLS